jgi:quercetin dioxygenase-like cupin family protein
MIAPTLTIYISGDIKMDRATFEANAKRDGFDVQERSMAAGTSNPDHTHPFSARLFVLSGEITMTQNGVPTTFGPGGTCAVSANERHAELVGAVDVHYVAGRHDS